MSLSISSLLSSALQITKGVVEKPVGEKSVEAEFLKEAKKTPAERMHEAMLKKLGLTEEQFQALDPETKAAVEESIREEIAKQAKQTGDTGVLADLSV
jgi:TPP-dependent pyruvate/acetoin dehydrogenase alpha subunit